MCAPCRETHLSAIVCDSGLGYYGMMPKVDGFLNLRKPRDISSAGLVEKVRRVIKSPCGHAGTLDPIAEGVLVIGTGEARKFIRFLQDEKEYEAAMRLGQESDTLDSTGKLTQPVPVTASEDQIRAAGRSLVGTIDMPVPKFSAVHYKGKRLYELARAGADAIPPVRRSNIHSISIEEISLPWVRFRVRCSGGTYVRSIVAEWGRILGCGAHLTALVRLRSGCFELDESRTLEEIDQLHLKGRIEEALVPARSALAHLPEIVADRQTALSGRPLQAPAKLERSGGRHVRLVDDEGILIGVGRFDPGADGTNLIRPERMIGAEPGNR